MSARKDCAEAILAMTLQELAEFAGHLGDKAGLYYFEGDAGHMVRWLLEWADQQVGDKQGE